MPKPCLHPPLAIPPAVECICGTSKAHSFTAYQLTDFYMDRAGLAVPFATCPWHRAKSKAYDAAKKERVRLAYDAAEDEKLRLVALVEQAESDRVTETALVALSDAAENQIRIAEIQAVRIEALADGQRLERHAIRRQVGQISRTPSPPSSQMSQRGRSRSSRDDPPQYYDAQSRASDDSDEHHSMKRKDDAKYSNRLKASFNFYWGLLVKAVMSIFIVFMFFASVVKLVPGIIIWFLNFVGGFAEVCAAGTSFCACANQNRSCDCDQRHGM